MYLVTKNHSFSDGNKLIATPLFLWFMNANGLLHFSNIFIVIVIVFMYVAKHIFYPHSWIHVTGFAAPQQPK